MSLEEVPELADDGAHPPRNGTLRYGLLGGGSHLEESVALLVQTLLQRRVARHDAHLRLQIAIHGPLAIVRRPDQRHGRPVLAGQVIPHALRMVRPLGLLVLEQVDAICLVLALVVFLQINRINASQS